MLRPIDPSLGLETGTELVVREQDKKGVPFVNLFRDGMATGTLLLWLIYVMNLLCVYFLSNWLPVIMNEAGHSTSQAVLAGFVLWGGGGIGTLPLGWFVGRRGFGPVLTTTFFAAGIPIASIGQVHGSLTLAFVAIWAPGFYVLGSQAALVALSATVYPTTLRSTGMGWAQGIGRLYLRPGRWRRTDAAMLMSFAFWRLVRLPKPAGAA
ncbi:MAG: MFS transporter [Gammaproteobacteria bacterium]